MPGYEKEGQSPANLEALVAKILKDEESRKAQQEQIDKIENNVRVIGNLICKDGVCKLATKEDLARVSEKQGTKGDLSQFSGQELWNQLKSQPTRLRDIENIHLTKLKKDEAYLKQALEDPELVGKMATIICNDEGCKVIWNTSVDKVKAGKGKGQKESFLIKKK